MLQYREVHTGDKHHYMAKEIKGVRIQQMPSLSGADRWHKDNNFVHSVRAASSFSLRLVKLARLLNLKKEYNYGNKIWKAYTR